MASTAPPAHPTPPSLSLPPSQFARLQPHAYLLAHLSPPASSNQPSIRANGRAPSQFRVTSANTGSLTHTNGSAVVRIGDTTAVCGVRAELLYTTDIAGWSVSRAPQTQPQDQKLTKPQDAEEENDDVDENESQIEDHSLLVPNLSLSTGCAPGFIPGAPPSAPAQALSHKILTLLHSSRLVRADDLRIWYQPPDFGGEDLERHNEEEQMDVDAGTGNENGNGNGKEREVKAFWVLYIDVMIVSLAGNPFDAAWGSVIAALRDTKLPRAWWDVDNETIVCSSAVSEAKKLTLRGMPIASSFCVFEADAAAGWRAEVIPDAEDDTEEKRSGLKRKWLLVDPDGYEEGLASETGCVVVDKERGGKGKLQIVRMSTAGGWLVDGKELREMVELAGRRWDEFKRILDEQC